MKEIISFLFRLLFVGTWGKSEKEPKKTTKDMPLSELLYLLGVASGQGELEVFRQAAKSYYGGKFSEDMIIKDFDEYIKALVRGKIVLPYYLNDYLRKNELSIKEQLKRPWRVGIS